MKAISNPFMSHQSPKAEVTQDSVLKWSAQLPRSLTELVPSKVLNEPRSKNQKQNQADPLQLNSIVCLCFPFLIVEG